MTKKPNPVDVHVGARVRLRRMALSMSQERLGEHLSLTFQQIQKYEKGANRIGASRLFAISRILKVPVNYFFEGLETEEPDAADEKSPDVPITVMSDFVSSQEGLELNLAFARIKDRATRRHLADLVRSVADERSEK